MDLSGYADSYDDAISLAAAEADLNAALGKLYLTASTLVHTVSIEHHGSKVGTVTVDTREG